MPAVSLKRRVERLERELAPGAHLVELHLEVQTLDGRTIYHAGGVWDKRRRRYVDRAKQPHVIRLVTSQLEAAEQLARWFLAFDADNPDRLALSVCVDQRRGGKTFFVVGAVSSFAVRYPRSHFGKTVCAIVVPTFPQQREIHETLRAIFPPSWFRDGRITYHKSENYYSLITGAEIWIKSADRPETLKVGRFSAVGINEAQQVEAEGILNVLGANIDEGTITWLGLNPPNSVKGLWAEELHAACEAVDEQGKPVLEFAQEVKFPASKNELLDQKSRTRYMRLAKIILPDQAERDGLGHWVKIKDIAYPLYNRNNHFRAEPVGWRDITADVTGLTELLAKGEARHFGAGMDFQRRPWCGFVEAKVLVAPANCWLPKGTPVFVIRAEVTNNVIAGDWWTEDQLCYEVAEKIQQQGRSPSDYLLIGDATGHNQGASGEQRGRESDPATWSWSIIESHGWEPHAPIEKSKLVVEKQEGASGHRGGPATRKTTYRNPPVSVRLNLMNELFRQNRIIISTACPETAESFRVCGVRRETRKPYGRGSHLTDAAGYLFYVWETALREAGIVTIQAA